MEPQVVVQHRQVGGGAFQAVATQLPTVTVADSYAEFDKGAEFALHEALADLSVADLLTCTAVWHPNGFAVFVLGRRSHYEVRLHAWLPDPTRTMHWHPPIHSHDRHVASILLLGEKRDVTWAVNQESNTTTKVMEVYNVAALHPGAELLKPSGDLVNLHKSHEHLYKPGEYFSQAAGVYHEIPPARCEPFITLCVKSKVVSPTQAVLDTAGHPTRVVQRDPVSLSERGSIMQLLARTASK